ncbi:MAG: hypothetical protein Q4F81_00845 [Eubacteriales bacterium]|nr:hypothetical protein [Clostridiales bacterium]MDO5544372.1 hypothetical protein [Eubacteriales bacterium]
MAEIATNLDGNTLEAFELAAKQIAQETGKPEEDVMKSMKKLIYLIVTRI